MSAETTPSHGLSPKIEVDQKQLTNSPYRVEFNDEACGQLFKEAGVTEKDAQKLKVSFKRKSFLGLAVGRHIPWEHKIDMAPDYWWKAKTKNINKGRKILEGKDSPIDPFYTIFGRFEGMKSEKRLVKYLKVSPKERGLKKLERLTDIAMQRGINSVFQHESKHAGDFSPLAKGAGLIVLNTLSVSVVATLLTEGVFAFANSIGKDPLPFIIALGINTPPLAYYFSILEIRARKFAEKVGHDSNYRPIRLIAK
ncbi:MAG TPA: hypothetical protein VKC89_00450 [Patescibacteria group bacterium]|nr:hypothetical protein [Patescibacteria group bacterium]